MPDVVTIRAAGAADLPACATIINDYIDATDWLPRTLPRDEIAALFEPGLLERRTVLVAEEGGRIVGYLSMGDAEVLDRLMADPRLLRLPLVRFGAELTVGVDEQTWRVWQARVQATER